MSELTRILGIEHVKKPRSKEARMWKVINILVLKWEQRGVRSEILLDRAAADWCVDNGLAHKTGRRYQLTRSGKIYWVQHKIK